MIVVCARKVSHIGSSVSSWVLSDKLGQSKGPQEQEAGNRCQILRVVEVDGTEIHSSSSRDLEEGGFQQ